LLRLPVWHLNIGISPEGSVSRALAGDTIVQMPGPQEGKVQIFPVGQNLGAVMMRTNGATSATVSA
jgi:hypothetical protein